jgi:hypothetical protein
MSPFRTIVSSGVLFLSVNRRADADDDTG